MTKTHLKNIVEQIKKEARPVPPPPANYVPESKAAPSPTSAPAHPVNLAPGNPDIRNMQLAIQKLAKLISSTIDYGALVKSMQSPPQTTSPEDKKKFQAQYGKDMFSNFMVNRYLRTSNIKGAEFDPNPQKVKQEDKNPSELKDMFIVLDGLNRVGQEKTEEVADGRWGFRTNNALKNIAAIADALMRLGQDLGMQSASFDLNKVGALTRLIPEKDTDLSQQEKVERSPQIAEILNGVVSLFKDFKNQVFQNPAYRVFIEGEPLFTISPKKTAFSLSDNDKDIVNKYVNVPEAVFTAILPRQYIPQQYVDQRNLVPFQITAANLSSPQAFDQWVNSRGQEMLANIKQQNPASWPAVATNILQQINNKIKQKLGRG